ALAFRRERRLSGRPFCADEVLRQPRSQHQRAKQGRRHGGLAIDDVKAAQARNRWQSEFAACENRGEHAGWMPIRRKETALKQIGGKLLRFVDRPWLKFTVPLGRGRHQVGVWHRGQPRGAWFGPIHRTGEGDVRQWYLRHILSRR